MSNKAYSLAAMFKIVGLTPGRRVVALQALHARLVAEGLDDLAASATDAIAHEMEAVALQREFRERDGGDSGALRNADRRVDRLAGSLYRDIAEIAADPGDPGTAIANELADKVWPGGAFAYVSLPYAEQYAALKDVVDTLEGPFAEAILALALEAKVAKLRDQLETFHTLLLQREAVADELPYSRVHDALVAGQTRLLEIVGRVVGHFPGGDATTSEKRAHLLAPIVAQDEAVREYYRRRRPVQDLDPATGAEVDEPVEIPQMPGVTTDDASDSTASDTAAGSSDIAAVA